MSPVSASAQTPVAELKARFERTVQEIAGRVDGVVGYSIVDLTTGERIGHLERATFPTASAIKLAIVYELFKQADEKTIDLDETITLDRRQAVGGTGVLVEMGTPTLSIRDYAVLMVTLSDNTATNILIDKLGMGRIAARMQGLGLTGTRLRRHMMDTAAARRGDENVSTPDELARLLEAMHGPLSGPAQAGHYLMDDAIALLRKPKENRLRKGLPEGVASADKSGELEGVRVDAGIVFAKNRPYVLSVMTTFLKDEAEGERAIEAISRASYEHFSRLGLGGALGRQNPQPAIRNPQSTIRNPQSTIHNERPRRIVRRTAGCGDASACLMLRTPLIRRDPSPSHQIACLRFPLQIPTINRRPSAFWDIF